MATITRSEVKERMSELTQEQLEFMGADSINYAQQFINLSEEQYTTCQLKWRYLVQKFKQDGKVTTDLRDFCQFFQIFMKTN